MFDCFQQEDWVKHVKRVASRAHPRTLELAVFKGMYLRLREGQCTSSEEEDSA